MNEEEIKILRNLLAEDSLEESLTLLLDALPNDHRIIQLHGRLSLVRKSSLSGEMSLEERFRNRAIIRNGILDVLKGIEEFQLSKRKPEAIANLNSSPTYSSSNEWFYAILFIITLAGLIYFFPPVVHPVSFQTRSDDSQPAKTAAQSLEHQTSYIQEKKIIALDSEGRKAEYIVFIVKNFNWALNEVDVSKMRGEESKICEHLKLIGAEDRVNREDFKGIICFGNTSFEEDPSLPKNERLINEEDRADVRAKILSFCVGRFLKTRTPIFISNLGKYKTGAEITDYQREIIIAGIVQNGEAAIDEEALFNGLLDWHLVEGWEIDIREYSKVSDGKVSIQKFLN